MILRIVHGRLPARTGGAALVLLRERLVEAGRTVHGLESLVVGVHRDRATDTDPGGLRAVFASIWRDVDAMTRATGVSGGSGFASLRLDLTFTVERIAHYEVVDRTFASLPLDLGALVRILTVTSGPNEEARLAETLRRQQPRLVAAGLVASYLGRRLADGGTVEAVHVTVWPNEATLHQAAGGAPELPLFAQELEDWRDGCILEMYDGIEVAPRLPAPAGPPLLVVDEGLCVVDATPAAAAMLGLPPEDVIGQQVDAVTSATPALGVAAWGTLLETGWAQGETAWAVPEVGSVVLRYVARRDTPVPGRHAVLVRRRSEPAPGLADLDAGVEEAFPSA